MLANIMDNGFSRSLIITLYVYQGTRTKIDGQYKKYKTINKRNSQSLMKQLT